MTLDEYRKWAEPLFEPCVYQSAHGTIPYRIHRPANHSSGQKHPLIMIMHGVGSIGTDNYLQLAVTGQFAAHPLAKLDDCFILAPQCPADDRWIPLPAPDEWKGTRYRFSNTPSNAMSMALDLLDSLIHSLPIDQQHMAVIGNSMGGYATWDIISRRPGLFKAAVPICGTADLSCIQRFANNTNIWIFHGSLDKTVLPNNSRDMAEQLRAIHANVRYTEYPAAEHDSWTPALAENGLRHWLNSLLEL